MPAPWSLFLALLLVGPALAQFEGGAEYRSVRVERANVRGAPKEEGELLWRVWKYMPLEVRAYKGDWLRVRDLDGDEGWMHRDALDETPTVMVRFKEANLREKPGGKVAWVLERGYALRVFGVRGNWLEVSDLSEASGWIHKSAVWGAVPR